MPPKAKFTREEIIDTAVSIIRQEGVDALTARELGARLGSSARPVFTLFTSMNEVLEEAVRKAKAIYKSYVERGLAQPVAFKGVGEAYIRFAREEPKLFQLLFMTEKEGPLEPGNVLEAIDENFEKILSSVQKPYDLCREDALKLYQHLWVYTHGIATLCATRVCDFPEEEVSGKMTEIFISLLKMIKE